MWLVQITWNSGILNPKCSLSSYHPHSSAGASRCLQLDVMKLVRTVSKYFRGLTSGAFHQCVLFQAWPAKQDLKLWDKGEAEDAEGWEAQTPLLCLQPSPEN